MSLYYEAADLLANTDTHGGSLKARIYGKKGLKSSPAHLYALIIESQKWSRFLKTVIEKSNLLKEEKKLTPILALLLTHDLLLSKNGVACPANHVLRLAVGRHKARLSAEFTKLRLKLGYPSLDAFRSSINSEHTISEPGNGALSYSLLHPRWLRINSLRTSLEVQLSTTFAEFARKDSLSELLAATTSERCLYVDEHVPDLIAVHPGINLSKHPAYLRGDIIFQDKASCFPAYLLQPQRYQGDIIDACAAPGNKTTHLAALVHHSNRHDSRRIIAFERNKSRAEILKRMTKIAGASELVTILGGQDFLQTDPTHPDLRNVRCLLLDPSCSGSGIVGRDDAPAIDLPSEANTSPAGGEERHKKRKRGKIRDGYSTAQATHKASLSSTDASTIADIENEEDTASTSLLERLESLSAFQLRIIQHAMQFPAARAITYSTCSLHAEENEHVVLKALASQAALVRGWRIQKREEQVAGMRAWDVRGDQEACKLARFDCENPETFANACIRCEKGTMKGTMGFFVACFVRDNPTDEQQSLAKDEEWEGFSDV